MLISEISRTSVDSPTVDLTSDCGSKDLDGRMIYSSTDRGMIGSAKRMGWNSATYGVFHDYLSMDHQWKFSL